MKLVNSLANSLSRQVSILYSGCFVLGGATRICHGVQIAVEVIVRRIGPKDLLLVIRIVGGRGQGWRERTSGEGAADVCSSAREIVRVRQIPQRRSPLLVREAGEVVGIVVAVDEIIAAGIVEACTTNYVTGVPLNVPEPVDIILYKTTCV